MGYDSLEDLLAHVKNAGELYADPAVREAIVSELRREGRVVRREFRIRRKHGGLAGLGHRQRGSRRPRAASR